MIHQKNQGDRCEVRSPIYIDAGGAGAWVGVGESDRNRFSHERVVRVCASHAGGRADYVDVPVPRRIDRHETLESSGGDHLPTPCSHGHVTHTRIRRKIMQQPTQKQLRETLAFLTQALGAEAKPDKTKAGANKPLKTKPAVQAIEGTLVSQGKVTKGGKHSYLCNLPDGTKIAVWVPAPLSKGSTVTLSV